MNPYKFTVPEKRRVRVIVHTDCKNEADDQFALAHHLMTPKFDIRGIIAGHFGVTTRFAPRTSVEASYDEINLVLGLMGLSGEYPVLMGAPGPMPDENTPIDSPGARFIVEEAMRDDPRPLYVCLLGAITDLACAYLLEPRIAQKLTAIWIGGGEWPCGGPEFNCGGDINAVNVVFSSPMPLWQVPRNVYKQMAVSLAELQLRVMPYGQIGKYLFEQMVAFNIALGDNGRDWPHGETWGLGDQATVTLLLEELQSRNYDWKIAPRVNGDGLYIHGQANRPIRVYHTLNTRLTMEDFYAKLALNFPPEH
jgi:inosine-uridine nucleoside N-ribohydrolase